MISAKKNTKKIEIDSTTNGSSNSSNNGNNNGNNSSGNNKNIGMNNSSNNGNNGNNDDIEQYFGCKYLTSSELLSLQIRDPYFRQQLAAQILFYVNFLRYQKWSMFF